MTTYSPIEIARETISRPAADVTPWSPREQRSVATLERRAPRIVKEAKTAGVTIEHIGTHPIFDNTRLYEGVETDWTFGLIDPNTPEMVMPRADLEDLRRLHRVGLDFPLVAIAHEVPKGRIQSLMHVDGGTVPHSISSIDASALVDPVPPPQQVVELSEQLSRRSALVLSALRTTAIAIGSVAAAAVVAPIALVGGAVAALTLDPIIIGVMPAGRPIVGSPASWYVLARWNW